MQSEVKAKDVKDVVIRFSGDSGDGMQLTGTIFSTLSAIFGNQIATFPDYPSEIRAPIGTLSGVSGYQIKLGADVHNAGNSTDVLVAMNAAALKVCAHLLKKDSVIIVDSDSFTMSDLEKAQYTTDDAFKELGLTTQPVISVPITTLTKDSLEGYDMDMKTKLRCKNMFALGLVCWLFNQTLDVASEILGERFGKYPKLVDANIKVLSDGYNYGHNQHLNVPTYKVETVNVEKGHYIDINGNLAASYGLVAAAEKSGRPLFLGSYPITPATGILEELVQLKFLNVKAVQAEDEISAVAMSIGASFAGNLAATSTSGPGLALKSEAIGLAVMAELPLVVVDVQRGGPSTGMPTKTEQTDLNIALYGRSGESPIVVLAASSPVDCFDMAFWASKIALEHITPVILLTDGYIANGSSSWRIPDMGELPEIKPHDETQCAKDEWSVALRDSETLARYWAAAGQEGFEHRIGGLERHFETGALSTHPLNHEKMVQTRQAKIDKVADYIPLLEVQCAQDADTIIVGWGGTYGHLLEAVENVNRSGKKAAYAHFSFISPLPKNTEEVLKKYKQVIVAEQNEGQFANYLQAKVKGLNVRRYNKIEGQPFSVSALTSGIAEML